MNASYFTANRQRLCKGLKPGSLAVIFSGEEIRKTNDEYYPFFADRSFVYLTGLTCKEAVLLLIREEDGSISERLYILAPDALAERWTGRQGSTALLTRKKRRYETARICALLYE